MGLCPPDLCECETQTSVRGNYVTYQIVYLFFQSIMLLFVIYTQPFIMGFHDQYEAVVQCVTDMDVQLRQQQVSETDKAIKSLQLLNHVFLYLFLLNFLLAVIGLFFFQLCQLDRKCCNSGHEDATSRRVKCCFKFRIGVRITLQMLIISVLVMMGLESAFIKNDLSQEDYVKCPNTSLQSQSNYFSVRVYYPILINLVYFTIATAIDNLLYFLKGCILSNLEWGSYHPVQIEEDDDTRHLNQMERDKEIPSQKVQKVEREYSFGRQMTASSKVKSSPQSYIQSKSPQFNSDIEMVKSNSGSHTSLT